MSGVALGGFMSGMLGGASMASSMMSTMKDMPAKTPDTPLPTGEQVGFGLNQPLVQGEIGKAQFAEQASAGGNWGSLKNIVSSLSQPAQQKNMGVFKPMEGI